ncbi:MAG: 2-oxoacid:acceptor oxidoreductase family protein [Candidatus Omnitrophota bacterium]
MKEEIICAGFGGQGIMMLGKIIVQAALKKGLNVTWIPSYGAEVRGGTAHCMVVLSDDEIASPVVSLCDTAVVMNGPSLKKFVKRIRPKGMLILNSSLADADVDRRDISVLRIPMTEIAHRLGNVKAANMVALGVYIKKKKIITKSMASEGITDIFRGNKELTTLNLKALEEGLKIA